MFLIESFLLFSAPYRAPRTESVILTKRPGRRPSLTFSLWFLILPISDPHLIWEPIQPCLH